MKMPKRSERRPMRMLPTPKLTIVTVYGSAATERPTPNSACTAGSATITDHMPTPPMPDSTSAATSRYHAYGDSGASRTAQSAATRFLPEVVRKRSRDAQRLVGHGMRQLDLRGVQHRPRGVAFAIEPVTDQWMADGGQVHANLVRAS